MCMYSRNKNTKKYLVKNIKSVIQQVKFRISEVIVLHKIFHFYRFVWKYQIEEFSKQETVVSGHQHIVGNMKYLHFLCCLF